MEDLRAYQRDVLTALLNDAGPRFGVVSYAPGAGVRRAVEEYVQEVSGRGRVLILAPMRVLVDQWASRLEARGVHPVVIDSAAVALRLAETPTQVAGGVYLATEMRLLHGPSRLALRDLYFDILIHDSARGFEQHRIAEFHQRAGRVFALVAGSPKGYWSQFPLIAEVSGADVARHGSPYSIAEVRYDVPAAQKSLEREAIALLADKPNRDGKTLPRASSRPELHARLLRLASGSDSPAQGTDVDEDAKSERAWRLLDQLEALQGEDSQLAALDGVLTQELAQGRACVVTVSTPREAEYVATHLQSTARQLKAVITAQSLMSEGVAKMAELRAMDVVVATQIVFSIVDSFPGPTTMIWLSQPGSDQQLDDSLALLANSTDARAVRLIERS